MKSVAGDALENKRRSLLNEAKAELPRHQTQSHEHLHEFQQGVRRQMSEVQQEVQVQVQQWLPVEKKWTILRHAVSQSLSEGPQSPNLFTTSRSGASESSSETQQLRQEHDHLHVHGRKFETETLACQGAFRSLEAQVA